MIADLLPDGPLKDYMTAKNPFYEYIKQVNVEMPPGANITGMLKARLKMLWEHAGMKETAKHLLTGPSPKSVSYAGQKTVNIENPIAYDVWYLYYAGNVLLNGRHPEYEEDEWIDHTLEFLQSYIQDIDSQEILKPLKQPYEDENTYFSYAGTMARGFSGTWGGTIDSPAPSSIVDGWRYAIKEARFEVMIYGEGANAFWPAGVGPYDSTEHPPDPLYGPKEKEAHEPYAGYIAFPVGQLGVMWKMSLVTQSTLTAAGSSLEPYSLFSLTGDRPSGSYVHPVDFLTTVQQGGQILPPFDLQKAEAPGELLIDKGYLIADDTMVEFVAEPFKDVDNPPLHYWLRYWIRKDNTEIIPGEFCGLLCRPWPLHCWFYQESSPFLYAGNWVETEFYTSGVVKCVLDPWTETDENGDPTPTPSRGENDTEAYYGPGEDEFDFNVGSKLYVVWVKNEEIIVESSDWKEYEAGERVGLLKVYRDQDNYGNTLGSVSDYISGPSDNFSWTDLEWKKLKGKNTPDKDIFTREWVIVPVHFYPDANVYSA